MNDFNLSEFIKLARRIGSDTSSVEVKTAASALPKDIVETISSFANTSGGIIVCGLFEKDGFVPAKGFEARKAADALAQACSDKMEPPVRADIEIEEFEDALVAVARIPETAPYSKPCYVKTRGLYEGSFVRTGEGDRKLSRYEVDRLAEDRAQPRFDAQLVEGASVDDLDAELVAGFLRRERAASPRVFAGLSDEDALLTMGVLAKDGDTPRPTLAGIVALGRHPQRYFPRANVTFAVFPGTSKGEISEKGARFVDSRTIIGSVPVMVSETLAGVRRNARIASFVEGGSRRDVPEYPEVAIREAVANALMHRDYSPEGLGSQVQVNMFSDRIEIASPGGLFGMVTVDNIGQYGASSGRNQYLSRILESTPYPADVPESGYVVENKGTGFAQMQAALKACGMPPAEPEDSLSAFVIRMRKPPDEPFAGKRGDAAGNLSGESDEDFGGVMRLFEGGKLVSTSEASAALGVSNATAYRRLRGLVDQGLLKQVGKGRSARYCRV